MSIVDIVEVIANISLTLTFVFGLVFGIVQVRAVERDRRERLALETLRNFQTREFAELLETMIDPNFPKTEEELRRLPSAQRVMFVQFGQQMESLGMLVAGSFVSLSLVERTLGSFIVTSWKQYKPIFMTMRANDPYLGEYFQWLAERIEESEKISPRDPFYLATNTKRSKHR